MLYTVYGLDFDNQKVNLNNQKTGPYLPTKDSIEGAVEINISNVRMYSYMVYKKVKINLK